MVTLQGASIGSLKIRLSQFGFDETNCIVLDGSGSSSMRVIDKKIMNWMLIWVQNPTFSILLRTQTGTTLFQINMYTFYRERPIYVQKNFYVQ
ncbi:hypothetical protein [Bacillus pseudomycoides]|uniref:hypothetical protein n=1 Tax=Bacillus pseudomycoides TaxID=64104 RepID=UPI0005343A2E|nr:hypothetical protein [Bacillus pseudomycoides]MED1596201.1 hypothetical protein [Bacillus pseudomycoides]OOR54498.1 hypothetical protein BLX05_03290 [Bacillus pseudomycoides]PDY11788.1 hypothetical protein COO16_13925 [Bacillus pseudomycoides]PEU41914.1 hypothetical protein CN535_16455 [Bacillus pseudomycoides]PFY09523.1 hypothetical protein COL42_26585 [Bacillus pseudomycoides]